MPSRYWSFHQMVEKIIVHARMQRQLNKCDPCRLWYLYAWYCASPSSIGAKGFRRRHQPDSSAMGLDQKS